MIILGALREVPATGKETHLHNRALVVVREAVRRGIPVAALTFFGRRTNFFSIMIGEKKKFFEGLPTLDIDRVRVIDFDDKNTLKSMLRAHHFPVADGRAFHRARSAIAYARHLGFPVVVKPRRGSLSKHTTCNIVDEAALRTAIAIAQNVSREFIVERCIPGDDYRITLIGNTMIACCRRESPHVVGDGAHTVAELIKMKNAHPFRGGMHERNFTLHKIIVTPKIIRRLEEQGLAAESVLPDGLKVFLHHKVILACGADIHDATDLVHPGNRDLFERVSALLGAPLVGIDFLCKDISRPYTEQPCAILEANSMPFIDMHHYPVTGEARDVAGALLDYVSGRVL